jgi:hypothetical protein
MKNWRMPLSILFSTLIVYILKFQLDFPTASMNVVGVILTIASILFGFLGGFFISELWSRYVEIRTLQSERSSEGLSMIRYAKHFFGNKEFAHEFKILVERASFADELIAWTEGHLEEPYFYAIENAFRHIELKNKKDEIYFNKLFDSYHQYVECTVKLDTLGKERLFASEWYMLTSLSVIMILSILFLDISHFFYSIIVLVFPGIITLSLMIIHDLNTLKWRRELVSLEPNEVIFDAIGVKRFYNSLERAHISKCTDFRTEGDLTGDLKQIFDHIESTRKKPFLARFKKQ